MLLLLLKEVDSRLGCSWLQKKWPAAYCCWLPVHGTSCSVCVLLDRRKTRGRERQVVRSAVVEKEEDGKMGERFFC